MRRGRSKQKAPRRGASLARPERFELPTFGSVDRRSIQLSYGRLAIDSSLGSARVRASGGAHGCGEPVDERACCVELGRDAGVAPGRVQPAGELVATVDG